MRPNIFISFVPLSLDNVVSNYSVKIKTKKMEKLALGNVAVRHFERV